MRTLPRSPARATPGPASARASSISLTQTTRSKPEESAWQIVDVARRTSITIPSGAETCSTGVNPTRTFTRNSLLLSRSDELGDVLEDALSDCVGADAEMREHLVALARGAEAVDADRDVDPAGPAERRARFDGDLRHAGGQNLVAVVGVLLLEELPARHRDDTGL